MTEKKRKGNPTVGLVLLEEERDFVDAFLAEHDELKTRSQVMRYLILWALGENEAGVSAIDEEFQDAPAKRARLKGNLRALLASRE